MCVTQHTATKQLLYEIDTITDIIQQIISFSDSSFKGLSRPVKLGRFHSCFFHLMRAIVRLLW